MPLIHTKCFIFSLWRNGWQVPVHKTCIRYPAESRCCTSSIMEHLQCKAHPPPFTWIQSLPFPSLDVIFHLPVFSLYTAATLSFRRWSTVTRTAGAALASTTVCTLTAPDYLTRAVSACPTLCKSKVQNIIRQLHLQRIANYSTFFKNYFQNEVGIRRPMWCCDWRCYPTARMCGFLRLSMWCLHVHPMSVWVIYHTKSCHSFGALADVN